MKYSCYWKGLQILKTNDPLGNLNFKLIKRKFLLKATTLLDILLQVWHSVLSFCNHGSNKDDSRFSINVTEGKRYILFMCYNILKVLCEEYKNACKFQKKFHGWNACINITSIKFYCDYSKVNDVIQVRRDAS